MTTQEKTPPQASQFEAAFAGLTMFGEAPLGGVCGPQGCGPEEVSEQHTPEEQVTNA